MTGYSELDEFAVRMESAIERFIGDQNASKEFVLVKFATDDTTGAYPQAIEVRPGEFFDNDGKPYRDRLPILLNEPVKLKLEKTAKWTDILSSNLWTEGFLVTNKALAVFEKFDLGNHNTYPAEVKRGKEVANYTYLFFANHIRLEDVDIKASEFYMADMIGDPIGLVDVESGEDFQQKRRSMINGEYHGCKKYTRLQFKKITFLRNHVPMAATFGLGTLIPDMYMRTELCNALRREHISGLEFRRNNRLFEPGR